MATPDDRKRVLTLMKAPRHLLRIVFEHLTLTDLLCVAATCKRFNRLIIQNKLTPSAGCFLLPPFGVTSTGVTEIDQIHPVFGRLAIIPGKGVVRTGADDGPQLSTFKIIFATATWPPVASLQLRIIGAGPTGRYWDGRFNVQNDHGITVGDLVSGLVQFLEKESGRRYGEWFEREYCDQINVGPECIIKNYKFLKDDEPFPRRWFVNPDNRGQIVCDYRLSSPSKDHIFNFAPGREYVVEVPEYCGPEPQLEAKSDLLQMLWPRGSESVAGQTNSGEIVEQRSAEIFYARPLGSPLLGSERRAEAEASTVGLHDGAEIDPPHTGGEKAGQTPQLAHKKGTKVTFAEELGKTQMVEAKEQETGLPVRCEAASENSGLPLEQDFVNGNNLPRSDPLSSPASIPLTSEETFTLRPPRKMGGRKTSGMRTPGLRSPANASEPWYWVQFPHHLGAKGDASHDRYPNLSRPRFPRRGNPDSGDRPPSPLPFPAIPGKVDDAGPNIPGYLGNPMFNTRAMGEYPAHAVAGTPTKPRRKEDDSGMSQEWAAAAAAHGPKNFDLWIDAVKTRKDIR